MLTLFLVLAANIVGLLIISHPILFVTTPYVLLLRFNNHLRQKRLPSSLWLLHRWTRLRSRWLNDHLRWVRRMNYRMQAEWYQIELSNRRTTPRPLPLRFARTFWQPYEKYLQKGPKP